VINIKRKGNEFEYETVNVFKEAGLEAKRQPLSGALFDRSLKNDIRVNLPDGKCLSVECKRRQQFSDYKLIEGVKKYCDWELPAVIKRGDRKNSLITLYLDDFLKLLEV